MVIKIFAEVLDMSSIINISSVGINDTSQLLPPEIIDAMSSLILIVKAVGIVFLIYLIYLIVAGILSIKRYHRIKLIHHKVDEIDKKLNLILDKKNLKKSIEKKKS